MCIVAMIIGKMIDTYTGLHEGELVLQEELLAGLGLARELMLYRYRLKSDLA